MRGVPSQTSLWKLISIHLIIRYLRFRGASSSSDSFNLYYATNAIIDHCSISFGNDEGMTIGSDTSLNTNNVTVQHTFFGVNESGGGIVGDGSNNFMDYTFDISYIQNVFITTSNAILILH